jgi:hypothetical protein
VGVRERRPGGEGRKKAHATHHGPLHFREIAQ